MAKKVKKKKDWIPVPMVQFHLWQGNLISVLFDPINSSIIIIPAGKKTALLALQTTYTNAYNLAPPHGEATKSQRTARNTARKAFVSGPGGIRKIIAAYVRKNEDVSDALKILLGIKVADLILTPNTQRAGIDYPIITAKSLSPGTGTFTFHEESSSTGRGKGGWHHVLVDYVIQPPNSKLPGSSDDCNKHVEMQRSPETKDLGQKNKGMEFCGIPCWVDSVGVKGPPGPVITFIIT
ncbi:MAG: hypothetical protein ACYDCN_13525 [Bacteroidia bacterium]